MVLAEFRCQRIVSWGIAALIFAALLPGSAARAESAGPQDVPAVFGSPFNQGANAAAPALVAPASGPRSVHILPAQTELGKHTPLNLQVGQFKSQSGLKVKPLAGLARPGFFPADLTYFGGLVAKQISSANVYYNCGDQSCWGNPEGFLSDLSISKFIHIVDQYVGSKANNRYPFSPGSTVLLSGPSGTLDSSAIENLVHEAASEVGPGHIFNIFLPEGTDVCASPGSCYSPDNESTFALCAYHSSVNFGDLGPVAYTVQPFLDVPGCGVAPRFADTK
jgi:hypothetical protein